MKIFDLYLGDHALLFELFLGFVRQSSVEFIVIQIYWKMRVDYAFNDICD